MYIIRKSTIKETLPRIADKTKNFFIFFEQYFNPLIPANKLGRNAKIRYKERTHNVAVPKLCLSRTIKRIPSTKIENVSRNLAIKIFDANLNNFEQSVFLKINCLHMFILKKI
jgi:hypothetical protein